MFKDSAPILVWLLNIGGFSIVPLLISYIVIKLPDHWFDRDRGLVRLCRFERKRGWYERYLGISRWKDKLPDGGGWLKHGFSKKKLRLRTSDYLQQFARETRRGEWAHWAMLLVSPLFLLWNDGLASVIVLTYALAANMPCIVVQRYNRARLLRVIFREKQICYADGRSTVALEE